MCLAVAGRTDCTDGRYNAPEGDLSCNLGRMPAVEIGDSGVHIGQSAAINYLVASECGLMGSSTVEAAQILAIQEHLGEVGTGTVGIIRLANANMARKHSV